MFGYDGSPQSGETFLTALIEASRRDDFSEKKISHDDGWGGVWFSESDQYYVRSTKPIFQDERARTFLRSGTASVTAVVHSRKAALGEPKRGPFDSHPFSTHIGNELVYVSHNGHVAKLRKYSEMIGVDVSLLNDTEVFTYLLDKQEGPVDARIKKTIDLVYQPEFERGALNLIILSLSRDGARRMFYYSDFPDPVKELYYSLYTQQRNGDSCVMSSTIALKAELVDTHGSPASADVQKCPRGELRWFELPQKSIG
jgi:predicted glutamine amidotransferase